MKKQPLLRGRLEWKRVEELGDGCKNSGKDVVVCVTGSTGGSGKCPGSGNISKGEPTGCSDNSPPKTRHGIKGLAVPSEKAMKSDPRLWENFSEEATSEQSPGG